MSVLIAAGIAVYENPQVRQWVDSSRRKIAVALHSLGDEISPRPPSRRSSADPSTRPDDSPEAEERRRRARHEILEKGRLLQEKRKLQKKASNERSQSFDDLVDKDGSLINEKEGASTTATDANPQTEDQDLRKRGTEAKAAALGSALANPFADELASEFRLGTEDGVLHPFTTRSSTPTLPISPASIPGIHPISPEPRPTSPESRPISYDLLGSISPETENIYHDSPELRPLAFMPNADAISNHSSEALVNLTPTTNNSSAAHTGLSEPFIPVPTNRNPWSVHEWAESTSSSFHSLPSEEASGQIARRASLERWSSSPVGFESDMESLSNMGTDSENETLSHVGIESDAESLIEMGTNTDTGSEDDRTTGTRTPGTWSEIGSAVSEDF